MSGQKHNFSHQSKFFPSEWTQSSPAKRAAAPNIHHTKPNNTKQGELLLLGLLEGLLSS